MPTYTVTYRKIGAWWWKKIKNVKGDGVFEGHRWFVTGDEQRMEVPLMGVEFRYTNGRFLAIKANMEKEAGQKLPL